MLFAIFFLLCTVWYSRHVIVYVHAGLHLEIGGWGNECRKYFIGGGGQKGGGNTPLKCNSDMCDFLVAIYMYVHVYV